MIKLRNFKISKILCLFLTFVILASFSGSSYASASKVNDTNKDLSKSSINILAGDLETLGYLEYTYEENGNLYKVIENTNDDLTYIKSKIYIKKGNNEFEKISNIETKISDTEISMTINENGEKTTKTLPLTIFENTKIAKSINSSIDSDIDSKLNLEELESNNLSTRSKPTPHVWTYWGSMDYSTTFIKLTVAVVTAALGKLIGAVPATIINYIVNYYIADIWITDIIHYKYNEYGQRYREKVSSYIYEDRHRRSCIGIATNEFSS